MPEIPFGFVQVSFRHRTIGDPEDMLVTLGLDVTANGMSEDLLGDLAGFWADSWQNVVTEELAFVGAISRDGGGTVMETTLTGRVGVAPAGVYPPNTSYLVRKISAQGGRENRGRMFIPGVPRTAATPAGVLGQTELGNLQAAADSAFGLIDGDPRVEAIVILHTSALKDPTPVTSFQAQSRLATQRRRLRP